MKSSTKITILLWVMLAIGGCRKSNTPPNIPVGFSADINNVLWQASWYGAASSLTTGPLGSSPTELDIEASDSVDVRWLHIFVHNYKMTTGTYEMDASNQAEAEFYDQSFNSPYFYAQQYSGTVTITKVSPTNIEGIFNILFYPYLNTSSGIKIDTINITNGRFNVSLN